MSINAKDGGLNVLLRLLQMIRDKIIKSIQRQMFDSVKNWQDIKIDISVPETMPLMNHKCHYNALNEYLHKRAVAILEVVSTGENPTAHYISMNENGKTYDATLGWSWGGCEYKLSKYIHTQDVNDMSKHLSDFKLKLFMFASPATRFFAKLFGVTPDDCF